MCFPIPIFVSVISIPKHPKSRFPSPKIGKSQFPFYPFRILISQFFKDVLNYMSPNCIFFYLTPHRKYCYISFLAREPLYPDHPVLLRGYPKNKKAVVGDSTSLYCADTSDMLVDYRWLKWNRSVKSFTESDLRNGTLFTILHPQHYGQPAYNKRGVYLKLKNLTMADEGLYTCLAISVHMGFSYRSALLTVEQPVESKFILNLRRISSPRTKLLAAAASACMSTFIQSQC
jgi:hypothetical protein